MLRAAVYLLCGWLLLAFVGGIAEVLGLTIMLPATSAILLTHAAFGRQITAPLGLAVAIALGYLEDQHQGAPEGTLTLAHGLAFLGLRWAAQRFHIGGWLMQALAAFAAVVLVDVLTAGVLAMMSDALGLRREALYGCLWAARWHALATALTAPVVWVGLDTLLLRLGIDEPPPGSDPARARFGPRGRR